LSPQASELPSYSKSFLRSTIKDEDLNSITKQFEQTFNQYRMILNVNSPDTITYTSKCIQEIIVFIGKIIKMNFAYKYNSCIYFDVSKFVEQYPLSQS
jgi:cysteinyl-tRNA synthetase